MSDDYVGIEWDDPRAADMHWDDTYVRHLIDFMDEFDHEVGDPHCTICGLIIPLAGSRDGFYVPGGAFRWTPKLPQEWPDNGYDEYYEEGETPPPRHWVDDWGSFFHESYP